ncbi:hypothetical protein [Novosphingobium sp. MMS21-SN21R]|uniref:hypothetical protein n=1 Tax=Novosphingobium sp. MMS21-SN21R TaxID=2969298 RepID=UPI0028863261|nr:hypothetical protein [Novosphingobium sp. MMS21-SN21R]MDT0508403.1 hypothetical protein [Novosphingobium sp. MMS21-SN21R]
MPLPRREDGSLLPALLALLLAALLVVQFMIVTPVELPEPALGAGRNTVAQALVAGNAIAPKLIVENDVFSPLRSAGGSPDGASAGPLGGAVVAGSVSVGGRAYAMVIVPGGRISRLAPGGSINGWRLLGLTTGGARFGRGSERLDVAYGGQATQTASADEETE